MHHGTGSTCHEHRHTGGYQRCRHGKPLWCSRTHEHADPIVGQPLCGDCYDYLGHVVFTWYLPELWRRFTIALRRAVRRLLKTLGVEPDAVRVSFVKVVEMQARAIPHIHALIRLDPASETSASGEQTADGRATSGDAEPRDPTQPGWQSPITAVELTALIDRAARRITVTVPDPAALTGDPSATDGGDVGAVTVMVRHPDRHSTIDHRNFCRAR